MAFLLIMASCETTIDPVAEENRDVIIIDQDITTNTTWDGDKVYKVTRSIDVTNRAVLTIKPGCIIKFVKDSELDIAYSDYGMVIARGSKENPILFTSDSPKQLAGDWYGFYIYEGSEGSEFDHCIVEFAGGYSDSQAAINLRGGNIRFINSTVRDSKSFGIYVGGEAEFTGFAYNTITRTKYDPLKITANSARTLGDFNTFDPNTRIEINQGDLDEPGDHYWDDQPIPFYFSDDLNIGSVSATGTNLTIAPGTTLEFAPDIEIGVGYSNSIGKLIAIGEVDKPIVFTSSSAVPSNGDWDGIWLYNSTQPGTKFDNCVISYGGGYSYGGNIVFKYDVGNNVEITNSVISYSGQYGIFKGTNDPAPTYTNITFIDNSMGDINW